MKKKSFLIIFSLLLVVIIIDPFNLRAVQTNNQDELVKVKEEKTENINIKDMGNTGIYLSLEPVEEKENTDSIKTLKEQNISIEDATQEQAGDINYSGYVNAAKDSSKAGSYQIEVQNISADKQTLYLDNTGTITKDARSNNIENEIEVFNNKIVKVDKGIVQTLGGYNTVNFGYPTIEDAYNKTNGTTFSGGAFDGQYISTEEYNGEYFVNFKLSGYEGYMNLNDVQIIPSSIIQSQSHYENIAGDWVYFEAVDPLTSNSYNTYALDVAPEWSKEGTKYYTYDDENYYEDSLLRADSEPKTSYNYFQNLPLNSTANYTGSDYKKFLSYKNKTNSQYYNATNAFVEAQGKEQVNSLLLFSMANHEGAYGTSNLSKTCNNFFGFGAYDSDPNNACKAYRYDDPRSGIIAQAMHLKQMWSDIEDWRFHGSSLGDKSHGMNVTYASDPGWGKAISSMMYDVDSYLKGNENKRYRIGFIYNSEPFYTSSSLNNKLKLASGKDYTMVRNSANGSYSQPRVLITGATSNALKLQLPTPLNVSNSTTCKVTDAGPGSYPNYDGVVSYTIPKNTGSFACDYGNDYTAQQKWYPKKDAKGYTTYKIINDVQATSPSTKTKVCEKLSNGNKKCVEEIKVGKQIIDRRVYIYSPKEVKLDNIHEIFNSEGKRTYYGRIMKYENNELKYKNNTYYTPKGVKTSWVKENFNSKGELTSKIEDTFWSNGKIHANKEYKYKKGVVVDYKKENYISNGKRNYYNRRMKYENNKDKYRNETKYTSSGVKTSWLKKNYNSKGELTDVVDDTFWSNGKIHANKEYKYKKGVAVDYKKENYTSNGKRNYYNRRMKYENNKDKYRNETRYTSSGQRTGRTRIWYNKDGSIDNKIED